MVRNKTRRKLSKLIHDRKGTAEIVGSVMFLVILLFVFTNIYLWHDNATREMNGVLAEKMNTPVSISNVTGTGLVVTNNGGFEISLSRLWLVNVTNGSPTDHIYVDLEPLNTTVAAGASIQLYFGDSVEFNDDNSIHADPVVNIDGNTNVFVHFPIPESGHSIRCKIITTLGNSAACTYNP